MNWRWKYASVLTACLLTVCAPVFGGGGGGGEVNTASNLGAGEGVFAQKNVADLEFKSLVAGTNIDITSDSNTITIDNTFTPSATVSTKYVTSDLTNGDSTVYVSISELDFSVAANQIVWMDCELWTLTGAAAGTEGWQLQIQGPSSPTRVSFQKERTNSVSTSGVTLQMARFGAFHSSSTDDNDSNGGGSSDPQSIHLYMALENGSNAGSIQMAFQPETSAGGGVAGSAMLLAGSHCNYTVNTP